MPRLVFNTLALEELLGLFFPQLRHDQLKNERREDGQEGT
jgi:hypothetical protein